MAESTNQDYGRCHRCNARLNDTTKCPLCGAFNHTDATFARMERENRKVSGFEQPDTADIPEDRRSRFWTPDAPPTDAATPPTLDYNDLTPLQRERVDYAVRNKLTFKYGPTLKALARKGWLVEDEITSGGYRLTVAGRAARDAYFAAQQAKAIERVVSQSVTPTAGEEDVSQLTPDDIKLSGKTPEQANIAIWKRTAKKWHDIAQRRAEAFEAKMVDFNACAQDLQDARAENAQLRAERDAAQAALVQIQQMTREFVEKNKATMRGNPVAAFWRIAHVEKIARAASSETTGDSEEAN